MLRFSILLLLAVQGRAGSLTNVPVVAVAVNYPVELWHDATHVLTAPVRWDRSDWAMAGVAVAAVGGTALLLDEPVNDYVYEHRSGGAQNAANFFEHFGGAYSYDVLGLFLVQGLVFDDTNSVQTAKDGLAASLIASGVITPVLKYSAGRSRPWEKEGTHKFRPFGNHTSFPSGHTTQAFAVGSVVAEHYDSLWVQSACYGTASMVGFARIYNHNHFASDVVAGAIIGTAVGRSVVQFNRHGGEVAFMPVIGGSMSGLAMSMDF